MALMWGWNDACRVGCARRSPSLVLVLHKGQVCLWVSHVLILKFRLEKLKRGLPVGVEHVAAFSGAKVLDHTVMAD